VSDRVVVEPIVWRRINEVTGIISSGPHRCADNVRQVPRLHNVSRSVHLDVYRLGEGCGIRVQDNSKFATVDIVVEISDPETAVIAHFGDGAVEIDSIQPGAIRNIDRVIEEGGRSSSETTRANPSQRTVRIDDGG